MRHYTSLNCRIGLAGGLTAEELRVAICSQAFSRHSGARGEGVRRD